MQQATASLRMLFLGGPAHRAGAQAASENLAPESVPLPLTDWDGILCPLQAGNDVLAEHQLSFWASEMLLLAGQSASVTSPQQTLGLCRMGFSGRKHCT